MALFIHCCFGVWRIKGERLYWDLGTILLLHKKYTKSVKSLVFIKLWVCLSINRVKVIYVRGELGRS